MLYTVRNCFEIRIDRFWLISRYKMHCTMLLIMLQNKVVKWWGFYFHFVYLESRLSDRVDVAQCLLYKVKGPFCFPGRLPCIPQPPYPPACFPAHHSPVLPACLASIPQHPSPPSCIPGHCPASLSFLAALEGLESSQCLAMLSIHELVYAHIVQCL